MDRMDRLDGCIDVLRAFVSTAEQHNACRLEEGRRGLGSMRTFAAAHSVGELGELGPLVGLSKFDILADIHPPFGWI